MVTADSSSTLSSLPQSGDTHLPYMPGLDGLRAIAVIAVLLYHAGLPVIGGFFGVEAFFVLSGFLITALLHREWHAHNQIDLPAFWLRRARRLLPALLFTLFGVVLISRFLLQGERTDLAADLLAGLGFVMNWHLIASGQSYFDPLLRPSLLLHLWSLAVEEQFYLLWPLIFVAGMRLLRRRGLLLLLLAAAIASLVLMAALYRPGADPSRIYYGTDTRAGGLLLGAALALLWSPPSIARAGNRLALLDVVGALALTGLLACFAFVPASHPLLYRGGFALIDVLTAVLIVAATYPGGSLVAQVLGWRPLTVIGLRSYALYLWHWPVFMVTRPHLDLPIDGLPLFGLRLAIVAVLVEVSYRWIELPVRRGAIGRFWHHLSARAQQIPEVSLPPSPPRATSRWLGLLIPMLLLFAAGATAMRHDRSRLPASRAATLQDANEQRPLSVRGEPTAKEGVGQPEAQSTDGTNAPGVVAEPKSGEAQGAVALPLVPGGSVAPSPASPSIAASPQPLDPLLAAHLQALLDDTVADGTIPGAALSISVPGYQPWSGASGLADRSPERPMETSTLVHISSITKMFTAVIVLQLAEEGKIDLDAPIGTYLPDIVPLDNRTSVRHLLSHRSGIFDYLEDARFFLKAYRNPQRTYTPDELVGMVARLGAAFEPGTPRAWKYSSTNYVILGMLVEQITGRTMAQEVRARIVEPLGLRHTFFAPYEPVEGTIAQGYIDVSDRADVSMTFVFATGNIVATAGDLRAFADGLFGGRLLNAQSLAEMRTVVETGGAYDMPELQYGLGVMQAQLAVGPGPTGDERADELSVVLGHIGGIAGSRAAVWHIPATGITIALSLNQANIDPNLLARDTLDVILAWQGQ